MIMDKEDMSLHIYVKSNTKKKTFTKDELSSYLGNPSLESLYRSIAQCVEDGLIEPVKASGTNGNRWYPIYLKYRKIPVSVDYSAALLNIRKLHPKLLRTGYLERHPEVYTKYVAELEALSRFFFKSSNFAVHISKKERSFEIFCEEKKLDDKSFCSFLKHLEISNTDLGYYETPELCFPDFIPERKSNLSLLICENKDIWYNIRRMMYEESRFELFGVLLDGVVFGQGNYITEKNALSNYTKFLSTGNVSYYYWGDIDRAGLDIFLRLKAGNPDLLIHPFLPGYRMMLDLSEFVTKIPCSDDHRAFILNFDLLEADFGPDFLARILPIIGSEPFLRLPQEVVTYAHLKRFMR